MSNAFIASKIKCQNSRDSPYTDLGNTSMPNEVMEQIKDSQLANCSLATITQRCPLRTTITIAKSKESLEFQSMNTIQPGIFKLERQRSCNSVHTNV